MAEIFLVKKFNSKLRRTCFAADLIRAWKFCIRAGSIDWSDRISTCSSDSPSKLHSILNMWLRFWLRTIATWPQTLASFKSNWRWDFLNSTFTSTSVNSKFALSVFFYKLKKIRISSLNMIKIKVVLSWLKKIFRQKI